ncbi:MAG TPA: Ppx/GppA phosphatase family protein [Rhodanobacteraceae bacterium]|nr:Ppx/GppA phosphatase family protein [Rhodanobacteraceae bacterium]
MTAMPPAQGGELLAAVDLGSNSFHLLLVRRHGGVMETVLHRRDSVRLAAGLTATGQLDPARRAKALAVLRDYAESLNAAPAVRVFAAATEAVRLLADADDFLAQASRALGWPVQLVSGDEEARLIWRGAVHALPRSTRRRLVIDIGGGSTELILGRGSHIERLASVPMGCVVSAREQLSQPLFNATVWRRAQAQLVAQLKPLAAPFVALGWDEVWAGAGTAVTLGNMTAAAGYAAGRIDTGSLAALQARVLQVGRSDRLDTLPGLDPEHAPIAAGGLLVMQAVVAAFGIRQLAIKDFAMRHGLLLSLMTAAATPGKVNPLSAATQS